MAHRSTFETKPGVLFLITPDFTDSLTLSFTTYLPPDNYKEDTFKSPALIYDSNPSFINILQYRNTGSIANAFLDYRTNKFISTSFGNTYSQQQSLLSIIHLLNLTQHKRLYWYRLK